jgi:hypothetical protein
MKQDYIPIIGMKSTEPTRIQETASTTFDLRLPRVYNHVIQALDASALGPMTSGSVTCGVLYFQRTKPTTTAAAATVWATKEFTGMTKAVPSSVINEAGTISSTKRQARQANGKVNIHCSTLNQNWTQPEKPVVSL